MCNYVRITPLKALIGSGFMPTNPNDAIFFEFGKCQYLSTTYSPAVFLFTDNNRQQPTTTVNNRQQPTKNLQLPTTTVDDPDQPTTSVVWLTILFIRSTKYSSGMYYNDVYNADHGWAPCVEWMERWWVGAPAI